MTDHDQPDGWDPHEWAEQDGPLRPIRTVELPAGPELVVTVHGNPAPQGSKRGYVRGGKVQLVESSKNVKPWREAVKWAIHSYGDGYGFGDWTGDGPIRVDVVFTVPKPASAPKTRRTWPARRPDLDKLIRSTLDAITDSGAIRDDGQIVEITAAKRYPGEGDHALTAPGAWIRLTVVDAADHAARLLATR